MRQLRHHLSTFHPQTSGPHHPYRARQGIPQVRSTRRDHQVWSKWARFWARQLGEEGAQSLPRRQTSRSTHPIRQASWSFDQIRQTKRWHHQDRSGGSYYPHWSGGSYYSNGKKRSYSKIRRETWEVRYGWLGRITWKVCQLNEIVVCHCITRYRYHYYLCNCITRNKNMIKKITKCYVENNLL